MKRSFVALFVLFAFAYLMIMVYGCGTVGGGTPAYVPRIFFLHGASGWNDEAGVSTDLAGGDWKEIVPNRGAGTYFYHISLSPDGSKVFLLSYGAGLRTLEVMDPDGTGIEVIETSTNLKCPVWSMDSQKIAFLSNKDGGDKLYVKAVGGGTADPISSASILNPSFSKDTTYIAYVKAGDIWYRNADGSGSEMPVTSTTLESEGIPLFSPEEDDVLVFYREEGSDRYLYKVNITSTLDVVRLNEGEPFDDIYKADSESAIWSAREPDHIYLIATRLGDSYERVYRVAVSGGVTPEALTEDSASAFDLKGFKGVNGICYTRGGPPDIYRTSYDGGSQTRITSNESADYFDENGWYP